MKRRLLLICCLALPLVSGCATTQSLPVEERTRTFEQDYARVFRAVVQILTDEGYAVTQADSDTGIINTDYKQNSGLEAAFVGRARTKVTGMLADGNAGTRVTLNIAVENANAFGAYSARSLTPDAARAYYNEFFDKVAAALQ